MPPLPSRITDAAASAGYSGNAFKYDIALSSSAALFAYNRVILLSATIIAILTVIGGIGFLASRLTAAAIAPLLTNLHIGSSTTPGSTTTTTSTMTHGLVAVSAGIGNGLVALGIAYLVMAYG